MMKVEGGGSKPVDLQKAKQAKAAKKNAAAESSKKSDVQVDAKTTKTLQALEKAIAETGLTAGQAHSKVDEKRVQSLLDSFERVEAKRPVMPDSQLEELADKLADDMASQPDAALKSFNKPSAERVADLLI